MKIFLAGASGVIGRSLIPMLRQAGHDVAGTTRSEDRVASLRALGARPIVVNVYDRDGLFAILRSERPEVVINQLTDLSTMNLVGNARIRTEGTRNLMDAALAVGVRRVVAQSISFVYAPGDGPAREDEPLDLNPESSRRGNAVAVKALEEATAEVEHGVVLRYGTLYGSGTFYARDGRIADRVRAGELVANDGVTSFVAVEDAAAAAALALGWPAGIVNIVDDEPAPGRAWLPYYASLIGAPPPSVAVGRNRGERGASNRKAREALGWQPRFASWRQGFPAALG